MKDYDHLILWLNYFDKRLSRREGRRVKKDIAVFEPTLEELINAAKKLGYKEVESNPNARYPRRWYERSAYIMIEKLNKKEVVLKEIAAALYKCRQAKKQ